ncbi:MAG: hypothetical protein VX000_09525, partial [Myxococcota bacterium]|nr:hypothetical protein [Myxococcota bacterium]
LQAPLPTTPRTPVLVFDCATGPCTDDLSAGGLLELPAAGPGIHFQRPLLQQAYHRRAILADPNRPGLPPDIARTESGRWLGSLAFDDPAPPPGKFRPPEGIAVLVSRDPETTSRMEDVLGPPDLSRGGSAAWDVGIRPDGD